MEQKRLIEMIKAGHTKTTEQLLAEVMPLIKSENFSKEEQGMYSKFRSYKKRYLDGELGEKAKNVLLKYFGYKPVTIWVPEEQESKQSSTPSNKLIVKDISPEPKEDEDLFS